MKVGPDGALDMAHAAGGLLDQAAGLDVDVDLDAREPRGELVERSDAVVRDALGDVPLDALVGALLLDLGGARECCSRRPSSRTSATPDSVWAAAMRSLPRLKRRRLKLSGSASSKACCWSVRVAAASSPCSSNASIRRASAIGATA
jgi:hypothetical protein